MYDILIKNGKVYDGTGAPWCWADVGVKDGRIVSVGPIPDGEAQKVIDARGLAVSPGFIDTHTHSDTSFLVDPKADSKVKQGVTTEVAGNCGHSDAPLTARSRQMVEGRMADEGLTPTWTSFGEYLEAVERSGSSANFTCLVGHCAIRAAVMGFDRRPPAPEELAQMQALIAQSMDEGAIGFSTGLVYAPSSFAETPEIIELCRPVAARNGFYFTHIRSSDAGLMQSIEETIEIAEKAGLPAQVAHHKATGKSNWGKVGPTFDLIDKARRRGVDVTADQYPYIGSSSSLASTLRSWAQEGGRDALVARIKDPVLRPRLKAEMTGDVENLIGWDRLIIARVASEANKRYEGTSMADIARERGVHPCDAALDLLIEENGEVSRIRFGMCEEDVRTVMKQPIVMIGSDGSSLMDHGPLCSGKPHPRNFGTFPRVLGKYVREEKVLTLEEAIRKMTSLPAWRLRLSDRGILKPGMWADITVFNPDTVKDAADFGDPFKYPVGVPYVVVNGEIVVDGGRHTGVTPGRVLRRQA